MNPKTLAELQSIGLDSVKFFTFTDEESKKLSSVKVTNPVAFDQLGNPNKGGLYDPAMGPNREINDLCTTCSNPMRHCPGHFGHIELPLAVVNPMYIKTIYTLLRCACLKCYRFQLTNSMKDLLKLQLQLLDAGHITDALNLEHCIGDMKGTNDDSSLENHNKVIRKSKKLLKKSENINNLFQNKNTHKLRSKLLSSYFKIINNNKNCIHCKSKLIKVTKSESKIMYNLSADGSKGVKILTPIEIKQLCSDIAKNDEEILIHYFPCLKNCTANPVTNIFFMEIIAVPPINVRPCKVKHGEIFEHEQTVIYKNLLNISYSTKVVLRVFSSTNIKMAVNELDQQAKEAYNKVTGTTPSEKLHNIWQELQKSVDNIINYLREILEKKTGIIRMNMMGKRVNFTCRSVITPDPYIDIDEIGIPEEFAMQLTYPVPVTQWNVHELRKMVINGPNKHPGAKYLEVKNDKIIEICAHSLQQRKALANRLLTPEKFQTSALKIVHRHAINGDALVLNRQPSLHKCSMMEHRARILKGERVLRLHYANCKSYNADFDGDEMNAHFPQDEVARSEAYNLMSVNKQYLVPKDGTPLSGLIQDHIIAGVKISMRGKFFNKSDYYKLVYQALPNHRTKIKLLRPAIIKPVMLWSGKQVLSTVIINTIPKGKTYLSLTGETKVSSKAWQRLPKREWKAGGTVFDNPNTMSEAEVIISEGELLCGVLDKTQYGPTSYGLVHCIYELYGGNSSSSLLSSFSKLFTYYLQVSSFSVSVKDLLLEEMAERKRCELIDSANQCGKLVSAKAAQLPLDIDSKEMAEIIVDSLSKDPKFQQNLDKSFKSELHKYTNKINELCLSEGLLEKFPMNNLQLMVQSGAKGTTVNAMQISCLLGQIDLEGKRPPLMISSKSLPCFEYGDFSPKAGGFVTSRFLTGLKQSEFFFHSMAGREGLVDTAVKTSRSGYLQRCLIKNLEGLSVAYDHTVRDADKSVIQFAYGEDGLDVLRSQFLKENRLHHLDSNSSVVANKSVIKKLKADSNDLEVIRRTQKSINKWKKKFGSRIEKQRTSGFAQFSTFAKNDLKLDDKPADKTRDPYYWELEKMWRSLEWDDKQQYEKKKCPDPVLSKVSPSYKFGAISEQLNNIMNSYLKNRNATKLTENEDFIETINAKYLSSLADPGEPVGLLAAQSIGEPSTQMTLNTFHFAGRDDMNVTLGIPRLREIIMTASTKPKTPSMRIPFLPNVSDKKADKLRRKLNRVTVADVLLNVRLTTERLVKSVKQVAQTMRFTFLPYSEYKTKYAVTPTKIIKYMKNKFFEELYKTLRKNKKSTPGMWTEQIKRKRDTGAVDDDKDDEPVHAITTKRVIDSDCSSDEEVCEDDHTEGKDENKIAAENQEAESEEEENEKDDDDDNILEEDISNDNNEPSENLFCGVNNSVNFSYDDKEFEWCEFTARFPISFMNVDFREAIKITANKAVLHHVPNIKQGFTNKEKDTLYLLTDGINIVDMFKYSNILDTNKLYSNDIHTMANTYGIEAASKVIVKEIQDVFNVYGITVDPRHLTLVADYMTYNGTYEPLSKRGMESSVSPLQQMSFETSLAFLKEAVLNSKSDSLNTPSSCVFLGKPPELGTGSFSLQHFTKL